MKCAQERDARAFLEEKTTNIDRLNVQVLNELPKTTRNEMYIGQGWGCKNIPRRENYNIDKLNIINKTQSLVIDKYLSLIMW